MAAGSVMLLCCLIAMPYQSDSKVFYSKIYKPHPYYHIVGSPATCTNLTFHY